MTEIKRVPIGKIAETVCAVLICTGEGVAMRLSKSFRKRWADEVAYGAGVTGTIHGLDRWSLKFLPRNEQGEIMEQINRSIENHADEREFHKKVRERGWQR